MSEFVKVSMNSWKRYTLILFCITLVGCSSLNQTEEQRGTSTGLSELEQEVHQLVNQYRISQNLPPLTIHEMITYYARMHSQAMASRRVAFGHHGFDKRVEMISRFLRKTAAAENVGYNNRTYSDCAQYTVQSWIESNRHRKNIEGDYALTGIGVAASSSGFYYFTQIFWK